MATTDNKRPKKKAAKKKSKKPSKYDEKIIISGTFEEVMKELVTPIKEEKKK